MVMRASTTVGLGGEQFIRLISSMISTRCMSQLACAYVSSNSAKKTLEHGTAVVLRAS
jgi:hypothetical protein